MTSRYSVLSRLMIGIPGTRVPSYLKTYADLGLKSVVIYGDNISQESSLDQLVYELRAVLGDDALIAIDEEGGEVTRVDYIVGSRFAGNGWLGFDGDLELTERDGRLIATMLMAIGINLNFAPVADVNTNPMNPVIGLRSFGSDSASVSQHVNAFVRGHESAGVGATLKHFPGHGDVAVDSHLSLPKIVGGWRALNPGHVMPFREGISAGASAVMVGHLDLGNGVPASLDPAMIQRLRDDLKFDGLVITDALDMGAVTAKQSIAEAAVEALLAGNDLACLGPNTDPKVLDEILSIWERVPVEMAKANEVRAFERIEKFQATHPVRIVAPDQTVEYEMDFHLPTEFEDARIFKLESGTNPAVGLTPWFAGLPIERTITTQEVHQLLSSSEPTVLLTRNPLELLELETELVNVDTRNLLVISTNPSSRGFKFQVISIYGASQPQTAAIAKSFTGRRSPNGTDQT